MLEQVGLTNFKAFAHQNLDLAPLTLLTGLNSSGKSTVLQSLALLRQSSEAGMLDNLPGVESGFLLNGELVELGTGQDLRHESYLEDDPYITVSLVENGTTSVWSAAYGQEDDFLVLRTAAPIDSSKLAGQRTLFGPGFQYLKADRIAPAVSYPRSRHAVEGRGFLGAQGEHTVNYLRTFGDRPVPVPGTVLTAGRTSALLDQTQAWLQLLCPGVNLQAIGISGTDTVQLSYGFRAGGLTSNHRYRPTNVGFGLTYALPIVVACLSAEPGSLLLLENPEAHLHPRGQTWLATLTALTAAAGVQIIMETHSDHVLNGLRLAIKEGRLGHQHAAVHFFRRGESNSEVVSPRIDVNGMLSEWPTGFFDEWENSLERLLD